MTDNNTPQNTPQPPGSAGAPTPQPGSPVPPPPTYQQVPPQQTYAQPQSQYKARTQGIGSATKEKWPAVVLAFVLGSLGIHKFYLGYKTEGLVMLLVSIIGGICLFGLGILVMQIIALIEAVKYVSLTEPEFEATYVNNYKGWF